MFTRTWPVKLILILWSAGECRGGVHGEGGGASEGCGGAGGELFPGSSVWAASRSAATHSGTNTVSEKR